MRNLCFWIRTVPLSRFFSVLAVCLWLLGARWGQAQFASFAGVSVGSGFTSPFGVAVDSAGNVFVADYGNNVVKEIVAIHGVVSFSSQVKTLGGGFNAPYGVAVDGAGDVFVADYGNNAVKEIVAVNGAVSSSSQVNIVGSNFFRPTGVAVDGAGDVFVADQGNSAVKKIVAVNGVVSSSSQVNIVASGFNQLTGVAVDEAGDVFVTDALNNAVEEIVAVNGVVSSSSQVNPVGTGFSYPFGVAVDGAGDVFVADQGDSAMKEIVAVNGAVSSSSTVNTLGSGLSNLTGAAVDGAGDVFVTDALNSAVYKLQLNGVNFGSAAVVTTTPTQLALSFNFTAGGTIGASVVLTQGATGKDFTDAGTGSCTTNGSTYSYNPGATCTVNVNFTPIVPGQRVGAVQLLSNSGTVIATAKLYGTGTGPMVTFPGNPTVNTLRNSAYSVAVDGAGDVFVASDGGVKEIVAVNGVVSSSSQINTLGSGLIGASFGVAVDGAGDVFVADFGNSAVWEIVAVNGTVSSSSTVIPVGSGFSQPSGVAVDGAGNVFVADSDNRAVYEIVAVNGVVPISSPVNTVGSGFFTPRGVAVDGAGNVFVADFGNAAVKEIVAVNGAVSSSSPVNSVGSGFQFPSGVAVDGAGDVFVADSVNGAVEEIVAVNGAVSSSSPVHSVGSGFFGPAGVAVDGAGDVFVADTLNDAVTELLLSTPPALNFPKTGVGASSSAQSVTIANTGNASLTIPPPATGTNPSIAAGFRYDNASTCPQLSISSSGGTLAPGASCTLAIDFVPTTGGSTSSSLVLTDNSLNAAAPNYTQQTIRLSGTGAGATIATITWATPAAITYGTVLSATQLNASSSVAGSFTYSPAAGTVLNAGPQKLTATFTPTDTTDYPTATSTVTLTVTPVAPTLTFAPIATQVEGAAPFAVSATSASSGAVTYAATSGPATIAGNMVTVTGTGTVVLTATQAASGNYAATTATISFVVDTPFTLTAAAGSETTAPGGTATYNLMVGPAADLTFADPATLSAGGLPSGATATISPGAIAAGSPATPVAVTIHLPTTTARNEPPTSRNPLAPVALGFLLLPLLGLKAARERLRQMPRLPAVLLAVGLSLGAVLGISGCGGRSPAPTIAAPQSYTIQVTAADTTTKAQSTINLTLTVQ